ncbi:MAG: transcription-repair coupling factor [Deltaproteobacteria bacterium]|nr:transcription-repair coupling factor [Deltaproteobacteria bacterium]
MSAATPILERLAKSRTRRIAAPHVEGPMRAHLAAELVLQGKRPVLVGQDLADAEGLYRDLAFLLGLTDEVAADHGLLFFGADDKSPYEERSPDSRAVMERLNTLYTLHKEPGSVRALVVAPHALVRRHVPPSLFARAGDYVMVGEEIDRAALVRRLVEGGYNQVNTVEDPGTFSVRGGIIDVFSPHRSQPVRLDLFGDEVESIKHFDPTSQRNTADAEDALFLPAREIAYSSGVAERAIEAVEKMAEEALIPTRKLHAVLEDIRNEIQFFGIEALLPLFHEEGLVGADAYLPRDDKTIYLIEDEGQLATLSEDMGTEARMAYERATSHHGLAVPPELHLADADEVFAAATKDVPVVSMPQVVVGEQDTVTVKYQSTEEIRAEILRATRAQDEEQDILHPLVHRLRSWRGDGLTTLIVCGTRGQAERVKALLEPKKLQVRLLDGRFSLEDFMARGNPPQKARLRDRTVHAYLVLGEITQGYLLRSADLAVVSEEDIFGQRVKRGRRRATTGEKLSDLADLAPGDFVVHVDYGIGQYKGMTKLAVNGVDSDYLHIEYKGHDKLYLPVHRLRLISKYTVGADGRSPALDKLGGTTWASTKRKVKDTLLKMASELLRLYAMRSSVEGQAFPAPDETYRQFEAEFAFEPTPDQQKAVEQVLVDLQKATPMDRLICGDVGYGKTEVAMRAAMMAVLAKKQVAVLVPTTVLAAQHYAVFQERFKNYPARFALVSRFQTAAEIKDTLAELAEGKIDVIIGTHRLLNKDVTFKELGLLVIDEEHRFGVSHKERLKKYRAHVHVLSMSATPIPRTLHMGFMGVRDMSMIATPPQDRLAVKTEVHKFDEDTIRDAMLREIRRGGQCFVVHNRVASIGSMAKFLERLVPEARIGVGHGQMNEEQLEKVMVDFMEKRTNVLLSTTIIESGIDISNANTILINRADQLGLAQLYQLKGRVGRGKTRGFAYFLIPPGNMTKKARQRIGVLQKFTELGAGYQVASKDLEIRGAGNILGKQQSGSIAQVGFEMYQALLQEAIAELKGSARKSLREPEVQVPLPAFIPDAYIPAPGERLSFYQRLNNADTDEAAYDILQEITELYGNPPGEVENLVQLMLVKQRLWRIGAIGMDYGAATKAMPPRIVVRFDPDQTQVTPDQIVAYVQRHPRSRKLTPEGKLLLHLVPFEDDREILAQAKDLVGELAKDKALTRS